MAGKRPTRHIGIAAVSPEGGALCYREVLREASRRLDPHEHPIISVHNLPLAQYVDAVRRDDWREVGRLLRESAEKLAAIGAEVIVSPDNATQHGVHLAEVGSPVPWLNMTELVAEAVASDDRKTVGIIGTRTVTGGGVPDAPWRAGEGGGAHARGRRGDGHDHLHGAGVREDHDGERVAADADRAWVPGAPGATR
ncbi:MAG: aspartate/glutamate racemase family protein [Phycisphaerales bacterium]